MNNQKQIATATLMYAQDHEEMLPDAPNFWGAINMDKGVLKCPTKSRLSNGYQYNYDISGMALGKIPDTTTFFITIDGTDNTTLTGVMPNVCYETTQIDATRHTNKAIASFVDGHVEMVTTALFYGYNPKPINNGFEEPAQAANAFTYRPPTTTTQAWTITGGGGVARNGSGFNNPTAPEGVQVSMIQTTGADSQAMLIHAGSYKLSFQGCCRSSQQHQLDVTMDGVLIGTRYTFTTSTFAAQLSPAFTIDADGLHTLLFQGIDQSGADRTSFIDDVKLIKQ
jgi:prepilin-type processing-associated H-X9-DG protein